MPVSQAIIGPGFLVDYEDPASPGWVHVIEVGDITGPGETTETVDVTNQDSDGAFREKRATLQDGGTYSFPSHFIPSDADQIAMLDHKHDRTVLNWRTVIADSGYQQEFAGIITGLGFSYPLAGVATMNVTVTVTGPVTAGAAS